MLIFIRSLVLVCMLMAFGCTAFAEDGTDIYSQVIDSGKPVIKAGTKYDVPFRLVGGLIIIKVRISNLNRDCNFIFDTGCGSTIISKKIADELKLQSQGQIQVDDPNASKNGDAVTLQSIRISDVEVRDFCAVAFDLKQLDEQGINIDGIIGGSFNKFFVFKIDYHNQVLSIADKSECFQDIESGYEIPLVKSGGVVFAGMKIDGLDEWQPVLFDTGCASDYLFFSMELYDKIKPLLQSKIIKPKGFSGGGIVTDSASIMTRISGIQLGDFKISNLPVTFDGKSMNMVGSNFLSQFTVLINYPESYMKLIPNDDAWQETNIISYGFSRRIQENRTAMVIGIWEDSPAEKSGLEVGDEILSITSDAGAEVSEEEFINRKYDTIILTVKRKDEIRKISITKGKLLPDD